jgi:hypothetical protein
MAKVLTDEGGTTHLRADAKGTTLCGDTVSNKGAAGGELTCPICAQIALLAMDLVTKAEKREWRKL